MRRQGCRDLDLELPEECTNLPLLWVGALSFERRCSGSLRVLGSAHSPLYRAAILDYAAATDATPSAAERREANYRAMAQSMDALKREVPTERRRLSPYRADELERAIVAFAGEVGDGKTYGVFDITCLTKIHTLVLAAALARSEWRGTACIAYTLPENYSSFAERNKDFGGFSYALVAPIVDGAKLGDESRARGVIVPGHESQRLLVALTEIEPSGGTIIEASTNFRPDFENITRTRNRRLIKDLLTRRTWTEAGIDFTSFPRVAAAVGQEIARAKDNGAPVLLYPFGPKSVIFAAAFTMASEYPQRSWFVYPTPRFYDVDYTEGVGSTYWKAL